MPFPPQRQALRDRLILVALWMLFYASFTLFTPPLLDDADSVHAEVAREMLLRHDFITLYANGIRYLEKAPLYYWSMAASMRVFGVSTAAARIPLALAVLGLCLLLHAFARRAFAGDRAGLYAGLITLSSFGIFIFSRINIPDVIVCLWLTLALYAFQRTEEEALPHRAHCLLFAAACALNILTKGLIGMVFPLGIAASYLILTRGLRGALTRLRQLHPAASAGVFLLIAVPWHILIALSNPTQGHPGGVSFTGGHWQVPVPTDGNVHGWAWFYFVNEQILRYLNLRVPRDYDTVPLPLFLGLIFIWLMPWSAFLPAALARAFPLRFAAFRQRLWTFTLTAAERTNLLLILWTALPLLFFCFSTRQEYYVLPALPPMILLIANLLQQGPEALSSAARSSAVTLRWVGEKTSIALLVLGTTASAVCLFFIVHTKAPVLDTDLSTLLQQNPGEYALSFGHFLDLNAQALGLFRLPLALTAVALFGGTLAHFLMGRAARPHAAILSLAAGAFLFLFAAHLGLRTFSPTLTSAQLAETIRPHLYAGDLLAIHGEYEAGSTLGFYLQRNDLHLIEGRSSNLWYGSFFPDAPRIFETPTSIAAKWPGPQRIFLWQDPHDPDRPPLQLPTPIYIIATSGGKQILSNQPHR